MDRLSERQERIEKTLYRDYIKKKGSPNMLVLYDVPSSYLEGEFNEFAAYGFDRDKKKGKKQIVIGLLTGRTVSLWLSRFLKETPRIPQPYQARLKH